MQSDTFLPDTDSEDEEYSSDSSGDLPKTNNVGVKYDFPKEAIEGERFLDQSSQAKYLEIRNDLFTRPIETLRLCFHNHSTGVHANVVNFEDLKLNKLPNVIGFELISANVRQKDSHNKAFVDLHIPEIPHKACKINDQGSHIIARLKSLVDNDRTTFVETEPQRSYNNYFTPIQLSQLTLLLLNFDGSAADGDYEVFYEFEITLLNQSLSQR